MKYCKIKTAGPTGGNYDLEFGWKEQLPSHAFFYCVNLESITIPNGIKKIGLKTFDGCKNLKNISLPDTLESIGSCAFCSCNSLVRLRIPRSVTEIEDEYAFPETTQFIAEVYSGSYAESFCKENNIRYEVIQEGPGLVFKDDIPYVYDSNGNLIRNATPVINGKKYYVNGNGIAQSGWLRLSDWQMYFDPYTYAAVTGIAKIDGKAYLFDENGVEILRSRTEVINGKKYWFQPDGSLMSGWCKLGQWTMYYDPETYVGATGLTMINGTPYVFDENGVLVQNNTPVINGKKYYADANGMAKTGWLRLAGWQMYFDPYTYAAATGITKVGGKAYLFDENGVEILKSRTESINGKNLLVPA